MALTATLIEATPHSLAYDIDEAGTAAATLTYDADGDLVAGPLATLLQPAGGFANQAAAIAAFDAAVDCAVYHRAATPAGATAAPVLTVTPQVSAPAVANNFRLDLASVKAANGDTAEYRIRISIRHSIVD